MQSLSWKSGGAADWSGPYHLTATRFTYRHLIDLGPVTAAGLRLRAQWGEVEGAVGLILAGDMATRTTYTLSVWRAADDLTRWMRGAAHAGLMRDFRSKLASSAAESWSAAELDVAQAWTQALAAVPLAKS